MNQNHKCGDCKSYEDKGHNYCRMCGTEFKPGMVKFVRLAEGYNTSEKFCGYCGGQKHNCACGQKI